jgi:hypothetical protein
VLGRRLALALASLAFGLLAREAGAVCTAASACLFAHVAHCCTATTCTFDGPITAEPSTPGSECMFDFEDRAVTVKSGGEFRIGSNSVTLQAGSFNLTGNGKLLATGRAAMNGMPGTPGGSLSIKTTGTFGLDFPSAVIDVSGTNGGRLRIEAGGAVTVTGDSSKVNLRADGYDASDAGEITIRSGAEMTLAPAVISAQGSKDGRIDLDAAGHLFLDSSTRILANKSGAAPGFAGSVNIVAASIDARAIIEANNGEGDITLEARTGSLALRRHPLGLSVDSGVGGDAGVITLLTDSLTDPDAMPPTSGLILIAAPLSAEGTAGTAGGGGIEVHAAGKLIVNEPITVNGKGQGDAEVLLEAAGDVELNSTINGTDTSQGAVIDVVSGRHVIVNGTISAAGRARSEGTGGSITIDAHNDLTVTAGSVLDASGASSEDGGEISLFAGHDLWIQGGELPAKLNANGGSMGGSGGSIDVSAGWPALTGNLTVAGELTAGDGGFVDLAGCVLDISGKIQSSAAVHALNRLTARTQGTVRSAARFRAEANQVLHLPDALTTEPGAVIAPAFSASEKPACTGQMDPPDCLVPCTCGDGPPPDPWEECDNPGDPCACNNCRRDCGTPSPCQQSQCSPDGGCLRDLMPDGTPCGPPSCPALATCQNGQCVQGSSTCGACCDDDGDSCTEDLCLPDGCTYGPITGCCNLTHPCPPCTECSDPSGGTCAPIPNCCQPGDSCDDQNPCTVDACVDMECSNVPVAGPQPACGGSCAPGRAVKECRLIGDDSAVCETTAPCNDGDDCTLDVPDVGGCCQHEAISNCCHSHADCLSALSACYTCEAGICQPMPNCCLPEEDSCDDENPCTIDACVNMQCTHSPLPNGAQPGCGAGCGIAASQCQNGECRPGTPCPEDGTPCTEPVRIDRSTGCCVYQPIERCCDDPGDCMPCVRCDLAALTCPRDPLPDCRQCGSNLDCDPNATSDRGRCGEGVCDLTTGECQANTPPICADGDVDTADTCVPDFATGGARCVSTCLNDAACDNGDGCDGKETCAAGACRPGTPLDCNDHDLCTDDEGCDLVKGCQHRAKTGIAAITCQLDTFEEAFKAASVSNALRNRIRRMLGQARAKLNAAATAERAGNNKSLVRALKTAGRRLTTLANFVARQRRIPGARALADTVRGAARTAGELRASVT